MKLMSKPGDEEEDSAPMKRGFHLKHENTIGFLKVLQSRMFPGGWLLCCVLLTLCSSARGLELLGFNSSEVICSQGLSECVMEDVFSHMTTEDNVNIKQIKPDFKLCCEDIKDKTTCSLCLVIDTELEIPLNHEVEDEGESGANEEEYNEEMRNDKAWVTVCYRGVATLGTCKRVEFTVNRAALTHQHQTKVSMVITKPDGFPFSSRLNAYTPKEMLQNIEVTAPSLDEVCSHGPLQEHIPSCQVPRVNNVINRRTNQMELLFEDRNDSLPSLCLQYEDNGHCENWNKTTIPLYSLAPCMCLQAWDEDDQESRRTLYCPVNKTDFPHDLQQAMWKNVSVKVGLSKVNGRSAMLLWNLSAPCRLDAEVRIWPQTGSCKEIKVFRQDDSWRQNSKGLWENEGAFPNVTEHSAPCVMVKVKGLEQEFGPVCLHGTARSRWSLLVVCVMLLVFSTALTIYFLHDVVKKWVWSWHHGGCVRIGRKGHIVLLSPPDVDDGVSKAVCQLGFFLCNQGFSVSVDQWSRKEQCTLGPLTWLHSQLLKLDSMGGRVLLVLTHKASERTEEWTRWSKDEEVKNPQELKSPYSDLFSGSLVIIQASKQLGRADERFVLVKFDSHPTQCHRSDKSLPGLLQGLPLFQLPSQTQSLLSELTGWSWGN